ncbi:MAG: PEP-CTERM sorting domain-containing protein [Leptospirillum sp.]
MKKFFNSSFKRFVLSGMTSALVLFATGTAWAEYIVNLDQVGSNVVATGSGTLNLTALTFDVTSLVADIMAPSTGDLSIGPSFVKSNVYFGTFSGPRSFGSGGPSSPNSGGGDYVSFAYNCNCSDGELEVPLGYTSGSLLSSNSTWDNTTLTALGVTPGTYTWTWGTGANADSLVLDAGVSATPEPPTFWLMATGILGMFGWVGFRRGKAFIKNLTLRFEEK